MGFVLSVAWVYWCPSLGLLSVVVYYSNQELLVEPMTPTSLCRYTYVPISSADLVWTTRGQGEGSSAALKQHDMHCTNQATSTLGALMPHDRWVPRD